MCDFGGSCLYFCKTKMCNDWCAIYLSNSSWVLAHTDPHLVGERIFAPGPMAPPRTAGKLMNDLIVERS